ncbi:MAG: response regulator [Bacteroidia bacterium]
MQKKHVILLVDDDPDDQFLFREALEYAEEGAGFVVASNGMEAISTLELEKPNMVFLDLNMPLMSGEECLIAIRENTLWQELPVVIYSTSVAPEHEKTLLHYGATAVVKKPHDFMGLCTMIAGLISKFGNTA